MRGKKTPVVRIDINGNRTLYSSVSIAAKENFVDHGAISKAISSGRKCLNYRWEYAENVVDYNDGKL